MAADDPKLRNLGVWVMWYLSQHLPNHETLTTYDILEAFRVYREPNPPDLEDYASNFRAIEDVLRDLETLGLVEADRDEDLVRAGIVIWRSRHTLDFPQSPSGTGGDGTPLTRDGFRGDDGPGGGIREVLSHPVLFALDRQQFDETLERSLEAPMPPRDPAQKHLSPFDVQNFRATIGGTLLSEDPDLRIELGGSGYPGEPSW